MGHYRVKEEELGRIQLGLRYVGLDIGQFYWQCLKLVAASEELTETDILRRIIRSWSETLPAAVREKARAETTRLERILCVFHVGQHCQGDAKHTSLVSAHQNLKSLAVAAEDTFNQPHILFSSGFLA
jgi:hypothetical protein